MEASEDHEPCDFCGAPTRRGFAHITRYRKGKEFVFEGVPARLCDACGATHLHPDQEAWINAMIAEDS